jgi:hypothetical protein
MGKIWSTRFYNGMGEPLKKYVRVFPFFRKFLRPIPNLAINPSIPGARDPISIAI